MHKFIGESYENNKQPTKIAVYHAFRLACRRQGLQPCSLKTFSQAIDLRPKDEQTRQRRGYKAAAQHEAFYWELTYTTPRHGERPYEMAHIDHTQLNLELLHSTTLKNLGRPWITFLIDAFTRSLLALYLSYDPPSYRSCMMVLRDCVRRHGRLPQSIVNDGGSEFHSLYYETLLARYECSKKERPGSKPRYGNVVERLFNTSQTQFIYNLTGNTQLMLGDLRQVGRDVNPKNLANWTLPRLYPRFCQWAELYNQAEHGTLGQSPQEALAAGLAVAGKRQHRMLPYNRDFIVDTMPTTKKGTAKVDPNRGIRLNYIYYWHDTFRQPATVQQQVPVRYDPLNMGLAYAYVQGHWVQCISEHYARLNGRSEKVLKLAAAEMRARNRRHTRQLPLTGRWLAEFIEELEQEEQNFDLFWREADNQQVVMMAEGNPSSPQTDHRTTTKTGLTNVVEQDEPVQPKMTDESEAIEAFPVFTL
ncbi:MAG: DDE-type integrase/transposase/recombinase [Anaerolineae bacterium]|nr:DDE-type integrase/transposase/recombinase [Anaerolineae bacterium]